MHSEWIQKATVKKGGRIELILPALKEGQQVEVTVKSEPQAPAKKRMFGSAKGQFEIMPDFDDPLPEFEPYR